MIRKTSLIASVLATVMATPLASAADLTISVEGISQVQGTIMLGLFDEATYNGDGAVSGAAMKVEADAVSTTFEGLEPGEYAIRLYHDLNDDGEMNTNPFGMPTEPYAFSNDAKGRFGPAKWTTAKFTVSEETATHTITMSN